MEASWLGASGAAAHPRPGPWATRHPPWRLPLCVASLGRPAADLGGGGRVNEAMNWKAPSKARGYPIRRLGMAFKVTCEWSDGARICLPKAHLTAFQAATGAHRCFQVPVGGGLDCFKGLACNRPLPAGRSAAKWRQPWPKWHPSGMDPGAS